MGGKLLWGHKIDVPGSLISRLVLLDVRYRRKKTGASSNRQNHGLFNVLDA